MARSRRAAALLAVIATASAAVMASGCAGHGDGGKGREGGDRAGLAASARPPSGGPGRGLPVFGPWASFYGDASAVDLDRLAATYRIINVDADPVGGGGFTPALIARLKSGGRNRVLSYLDLGSAERSRDYWSRAPAGFVPAGRNLKARLGAYAGYPDEVWMNPADPDWRHLLLDHVVPRLVAQGVDGFYLDNLEVVEHRTAADGGRCDVRCAQGGLELVAALRARYPRLLLVMQNATGERTLHGTTSAGPFPALLDGIAHEDVFTAPRDTGNGTDAGAAGDTGDAGDAVYGVRTDGEAVAELKAWRDLGLRPGGRPLWIATEDYVNSCANRTDAATVLAGARANGFSAYVSDKSASQNTVCDWGGPYVP